MDERARAVSLQAQPDCRTRAARRANKVICSSSRRSGPDATAPSGAPVLEGVSAWIDCTLWAEHDGGDHTMLQATALRLQRMPKPTLAKVDGVLNAVLHLAGPAA